MKEGVVACKDMKTGEQTKLDFQGTLERIREGLTKRNEGPVIVV